MTQKIGQSPTAGTPKSRLAEKRAAALKANLRRRKDQNAAREDLGPTKEPIKELIEGKADE